MLIVMLLGAYWLAYGGGACQITVLLNCNEFDWYIVNLIGSQPAVLLENVSFYMSLFGPVARLCNLAKPRAFVKSPRNLIPSRY